MPERLVECVPNFSEGRDPAKIRKITEAIEGVAGVRLLDVDPGADTNRTVVTFVGPPDAVAEAAFRAAATAAQVIDMRTHHGAHPRMGATDVCPFVPVAGVTMDDCVALARKVGERIGRELEIPVYLYEYAATRPQRRNLAEIRKGEYEGLAKKLADPAWAPDFGPARFHPTAGATCVGAREFLIAYNITLNTRDKAAATDIAFELRERGRAARKPNPTPFYYRGEIMKYAPGFFPCGNCDFVGTTIEETQAHCRDAHGYDLAELFAMWGQKIEDPIGKTVRRAGRFRHCKAIGWYVAEYGRAQLSINLTNDKVTPPHLVLEEARRLATERGLVVTGSESVGVVPYRTLHAAGVFYLERQGRSPFVPPSDILDTAVFSMGLSDVAPFEVEKKVLGLPAPGELVSKRVVDFTDEVSRDTPAPGGGSVSALAGALGAALGAMVANLTHGKGGEDAEALLDVARRAQEAKERLLSAVDDDTHAFNAYMEAMRLPRRTPEEKRVRAERIEAGLKAAV
ncbi:MAG: glutamate formimidoyltransferase, partial [Deltaproteobacteria bacterium]